MKGQNRGPVQAKAEAAIDRPRGPLALPFAPAHPVTMPPWTPAERVFVIAVVATITAVAVVTYYAMQR